MYNVCVCVYTHRARCVYTWGIYVSHKFCNFYTHTHTQQIDRQAHYFYYAYL